MNVKWLRRLKGDQRTASPREETSKYTDLMPDGTAREFTFYMEAKSIITRALVAASGLTEKGFMKSAALRWSGRGKRSRRVDVSVDGGAT